MASLQEIRSAAAVLNDNIDIIFTTDDANLAWAAGIMMGLSSLEDAVMLQRITQEHIDVDMQIATLRTSLPHLFPRE